MDNLPRGTLVNLKDLSIGEITEILDIAEEFMEGKRANLGDKLVANLFFEPSTRTRYSFEAAESRLGCQVLSFAKEASSMLKGESLYDTVKTFSQYVDAIIIRHSEDNFYEDLLGNIPVPIINGGDGSGNHPTQSLLDLLTIRQEFGRFEGLKIVIAGDIAHSRVAHTNIEVMRRLGMEVFLSAPPELQDDEEYVELDDIIGEVDIVMLLRVQFERHQEKLNISQEEYHRLYGLTLERYEKIQDHAIIMHPAPVNRGLEIDNSLVECEKSRIFKQMKNGMYIRMAVLYRALTKGDEDDSY